MLRSRALRSFLTLATFTLLVWCCATLVRSPTVLTEAATRAGASLGVPAGMLSALTQRATSSALTGSGLHTVSPWWWAVAHADVVVPVGASVAAGGVLLVLLFSGYRWRAGLRRVARWGLVVGGLPLGAVVASRLVSADAAAIAAIVATPLRGAWIALLAGAGTALLVSLIPSPAAVAALRRARPTPDGVR